MAKFLRNMLAATALAVATGTVIVASPAQAIPYPGTNESITYTYFSDSSKTVQVGMWVYGNCLEDFQYGQKTAYYTITRITCNDPSW
ncbi:hypothetical protein V6U90_17390 [Micromonospora sp. CPCC 206060]|uniref:hypothetical protein n=1 Tax=Micromonospora sp. CPCC 206060 TaxID=3122406 RepID=UPI002FEF8284